MNNNKIMLVDDEPDILGLPEKALNIEGVHNIIKQMASWVDGCSVFDDTVDWEKVDYKTFAKILYMGKIYE
ncbi:hypothetical protein [Petralouisia muris]|uniref:hypothetical protein n=1 Tax=Petralouisia muris TaxID=3032872 RepID=UPI0023B7CB23|nr:hypothetical protein [Petralouisia muris]